ncbi:hypothetical protein [Sphingobacterium corticibacter]|uniref:Uncharacterized protein n=1 Tax=Sphingobacterium corticibacter TaxID=2171749 RepID=A0A2T8HNG8_9SPHI|nr:hypothetical protein [Sphingobacterium corticibacter]PVH26994.1 hypothetical protein DC487_05205 [Sphingobacterium corticibacter]
MIHAIYIYFIINAFLAGGVSDNWKQLIIYFLFGLPYAVCMILYHRVIRPISESMELITLYRLYFSKHFEGENHPTWKDILMDLYPRSSLYRKWVIRLIARKYGWEI